MGKRIECSELPGNWVEVAEAWTRRELREALNEENEPFAALLRRKITACRLETGGGEPITEPAKLTSEALDEGLRYEVYCWLMTTITRFVIEVQRLGELTQRRLWRELGGGPAAAMKEGMETTEATEPVTAASGDLSLSPML